MICGLIILNLLLTVAVKWQLIFRVEELRCAISKGQAVPLESIILFLFLSCLAFTVIDFVQTLRLVYNAVPPVQYIEKNVPNVTSGNTTEHKTLRQLELEAVYFRLFYCHCHC